MTDEILISVMSPEAQGQSASTGGIVPPSRPAVSMAKRLDTLEGKTVYLVDIGFGGGYNFMLEIQRWFAEHMPSVTTVPRRKPGQVFSDTNNEELWEEIKEKGDAVVIGVAG